MLCSCACIKPLYEQMPLCCRALRLWTESIGGTSGILLSGQTFHLRTSLMGRYEDCFHVLTHISAEGLKRCLTQKELALVYSLWACLSILCRNKTLHMQQFQRRAMLQVVAVIYIALTIITQLSIISIRNPSFWWHFSKKTAPTPSWKLALPVTLFLVGSTFIAGMLAVANLSQPKLLERGTSGQSCIRSRKEHFELPSVSIRHCNMQSDDCRPLLSSLHTQMYRICIRHGSILAASSFSQRK